MLNRANVKLKSKKKFIIALVALCVFSIALIGVVAFVLGLTSTTAQTNLNVTYTASGNVYVDVTTDYTIGEYDTPLTDTGSNFTQIGSTIHFTPTQSNEKAMSSSSLSSLNFNIDKYLVLRYKFENKSENTGFILQATPTLVGSNMQAFYFQSKDTNKILMGDYKTGGLSSPNVTALSSNNIKSSSSYVLTGSEDKFVIGTKQTKYIYLVITSVDTAQTGSLTAVNWDLTTETAPVTTITINPVSSTISTIKNKNRATTLAGEATNSISPIQANSNLILKDILDDFILQNTIFAGSYSCWFTTNSCNEYIDDWDCLGSLATASNSLNVYSHAAVTTGLSINSNGVVTKSWTPTGDIYLPFTAKSIYGTTSSNGAFANCSGLTNIYMPSSITDIGSYAFYYCTSLTNITIPSSVTSVGKGAYYSCTNLTAITIPNSVTSIVDTVFYNCSNLTSITIPSTVTSIGDSAFYGCTSLTSITIPSGVTSIGSSAFSNCSGLTSITIPSGVTSIGSSAFSNCSSLANVIIGNSVTSIGSYAFYNCFRLVEVCNLSSLNITVGSTSYGYLAYWAKQVISDPSDSKLYTDSINGLIWYNDEANNKKIVIGPTDLNCSNITIDNTYHEINNCAFYECFNLKRVRIGSSVTSIRNSAFYNCYRLVEVCNLSGLTITKGSQYNGYIGYYAKDVYATASYTSKLHTDSVNGLIYYQDGANKIVIGPTNLNVSSITIDDTYTSINQYAFYYCSSLTSVTIPDSVTSIDSHAFYYCSSLTSITIPDSVTSIGNSAFYRCSSLTSITIPDSVTSIGQYAFSYCLKLTSVTIGNSVTSIGQFAFSSCSKLTSVTIGNSVTSIGTYAFSNCSSLTSVTIGNSVTSISNYAFNNCSKLTTVYIDSSTIANGLRSKTSYGYLINYATTIYVKTDISDVSGSTYLANNFTLDTSTTYTYGGSSYYKYTENS